MPPMPSAAEAAAHQALLDSLDIQLQARPFRNPNWKPSVRRNKNLKQMTGEASRREASTLATNANNSGATTPMVRSASGIEGSGGVTPVTVASSTGGGSGNNNLSAATQSLDRLVLERNLQAAAAAAAAGGGGADASTATSMNGDGVVLRALPAVTYTNIESAPSLNPAGKRPYCDITGLPSKYTDPKTRLRYHDREVFAVVRSLPQGLPERYLEARAAHVVLK